MPLFEYECGECRHITEFLESRDSKSVHQCEKCGSNKMQRVMSLFSASSDGRSITGGSSCNSCSSGSCSTCGH